MPFLSPAERRTLALICDTLLPSIADDPTLTDDPLAQFGAADLDLVTALETALERVSDGASLSQLKLVLTLFETQLVHGIGAGVWHSFEDMTRPQRETVLRAWAYSRVPQARMTFQSLKRLGLAVAYGLMPADAPNPLWAAFGYEPPRLDPLKPAERPIIPLKLTAATTLTADVVIIGSGAGGGVVAGELTAAGKDVIVVEKGDYYIETDFDGRELSSNERLYENSGALTTADRGILVLAGKALGGGTTVNWAASFHTPDHVRHEWAHDYGFEGATSPEFSQSQEAVWARSHVNLDHSAATSHNGILEKGCQALGYEVTAIPRNVKDCEECGFCNYGCAYGAKQSTVRTYLQDAQDRGGRILVRAEVDQILHAHGVATGVRVTVRTDEGTLIPVTIHAKTVVVAAGSLHTPAILLRSGLGNANIGAHLHLHPTTVTFGIYEQSIRGWQGAPLTRVSNQFADLDGDGYGVKLETAPVHPGIAALSLPWSSGRQHRAAMAQLAHFSNTIIIARDRFGGRITLDRAGQPILHYTVHPHDRAHLLRGMIETMRIHHAAGAHEITSPHADALIWQTGQDFEAYLTDVSARELRPNGVSMFSAHQMSSARIGGNSALGAFDPTGQSYEVRNLYVADGSALPTASGVNPMMTIMATAHYIAQQIKARM